MKKITLFMLLFFVNYCFSQKERSTQLGQTTLEELQMTFYEKDSSANAVMLYEEGNYYYSNYKKRIANRDYYTRIKILKKEGLDFGSYTIPVAKEIELSNLNGITYNLENGKIVTSKLDPKDIIIDDNDEYYTKYIINLPNVKIGSVIEFTYTVLANGLEIKSWTFQSEIPKIKSKFIRLTPVTMDYIVNLIGPIKLTNLEKIEKTKCFPEKRRSLECSLTSYEMLDLPAFKEEVLMPNKSVLISKLKFRFSYFLEIGYRKYEMMSKWSQFDNAMKRYYFDQEMTKERFFKKIIPDDIIKNGTQLTIAKNIYHFVQDHYTWNGRETGDTRINIRNNYKNKEASVDLIATTLYNSLKGAGIECYYVAVSTDGLGPIDKVLPNIKDFNYTVIKAVIDGKSYFLDATDKALGFGYVQPFASVKDGRVLDFDHVNYGVLNEAKGTYWQAMKPLESSSRIITTEVKLNKEGDLEGKMMIKRSGYNAYKFRRKVNEVGKDKIAENFTDNQNDFEIADYQITKLNDRDQSVFENLTFSENSDENVAKSKIRFRPILFDPFQVNPFLKDKRSHPIDFKYQRNLKYRFSFNIPEGYKVTNLPENKNLKLPENGLGYLYKIENKNGKINIYVNLKISQTYYSVDKYQVLKKLYNQIVTVEKSYIELEKIN
tara:strand:- start:46637 stop:48616 length:1980 start_codon:yes stop_codon:yes gene_type:complete